VTLATKGTLGVGTVTIAGLPVASVNTANLSASIVISSYLLTTAVVWVVGNITPGASAIQVVQNAAASASGSNTTVADLAATSTFSFSGTYFTA
jgi:CBS domain containing-hemolysin-like protein